MAFIEAALALWRRWLRVTTGCPSSLAFPPHLLVTMTMMEIRVVGMQMELWVVNVGMSMGFLLVPMLMMGIMLVPMIMREGLVPVSV